MVASPFASSPRYWWPRSFLAQSPPSKTGCSGECTATGTSIWTGAGDPVWGESQLSVQEWVVPKGGRSPPAMIVPLVSVSCFRQLLNLSALQAGLSCKRIQDLLPLCSSLLIIFEHQAKEAWLSLDRTTQSPLLSVEDHLLAVLRQKWHSLDLYNLCGC